MKKLKYIFTRKRIVWQMLCWSSINSEESPKKLHISLKGLPFQCRLWNSTCFDILVWMQIFSDEAVDIFDASTKDTLLNWMGVSISVAKMSGEWHVGKSSFSGSISTAQWSFELSLRLSHLEKPVNIKNGIENQKLHGCWYGVGCKNIFENKLQQWIPALFKLSIMLICLNFFLGGETEAHSAFIAENAEQYYLA